MPRTHFHLPPNTSYTILDSLHDSVRFARHCLVEVNGHLGQAATFVDPEGAPMLWHDFGVLEGPGWASDAIGGAHILFEYGHFMGREDVQRDALKVLDHVLYDGFIDDDSGFISGYRHIPDDRLCLNYKSRDDWFCVGSMARMADQLLRFSIDLQRHSESGKSDLEQRVLRMQHAALACSQWIIEHAAMAPNSWVPRRSLRDGSPYRLNPEGGNDILFDRSADGLFLIDLWTSLTVLGLADYRARLHELAQVFIRSGGFFGSINHDTYDEHECVAYAVAFRTFLRLGRLMNDDTLRQFAYDVVLAGLKSFEMSEDRNGVETKGLLYMERSWDTAYLWENAEAAQAYLEAYTDKGTKGYLLKALTILRAIAKHHHGAHGFLTEGVDWNNHVGARHHFNGETYGDIQYTEPLLNNLHHAEPTLYYLTHCIDRD